MKIMHLLESRCFSGAENVVCQIIGLFSDVENTEMVYCSRDGQIRQALSERHITFVPVASLSVSEVRRVIREQKPDIIHAHDMRASFIAALVCGKIKLISHIHNNNFDSRGLSVKSVAYLSAGLKAKHIFFVSDSAFNGYAFHRLLKNKSEVLYNTIDAEALRRKMAQDEKVYDYDAVYLGRITTPKNPIRLMNVLKKLIDKKTNVKIAVIGVGDLEKETKDEAKRLGIEANIDFLGYLTNPYKILHDAKLLLMTSLWEGTPMCVLEAMSLGVPVISTPTDGVKTVVVDRQTGFLSDSDDELVKDCIAVIEDEALHKKMSLASIRRVEELSDLENYKHRIHSVYYS